METTGEPPRASWLGRAAREAFPLLVLLAVTAKLTADGWHARDLTLTDETSYLGAALRSEAGWERSVEEGPLYVHWYRLLMRLPVPLPYLPYVGHALLMAVLAVLFYALVRRLGAGRWVAAGATGLVFLNTRLAAIEPFPVHLATAVLATGVLVGSYRRSALGACGPIGFALLIAYYARPEFGAALLAFCPLYLTGGVWWCARGRGDWREFLGWAVPLVLAVAVCGASVGLPLPNGPRGWVAFAQHYGFNAAVHERREITSPDRAAREDFGEVRSVGEAARARPDAFARHVWRNVAQLPATAFRLTGPDLGLAWTFRAILQAVAVAALVAGLVGVVRRVRGGGLRGPDAQPLRATFLALACVAAAAGPSVLVIFPRDHYLLLPLFFLLALGASGLPAPRWPAGWLGAPARWKVRAAGFAAGALLVGVTPTPVHGWTLLRPLAARTEPPAPARQREVAVLLRSLPLREPVVVVEHSHYGTIRTLWMRQPAFVIEHDRKAEGFRAFVAKHGVQVVVLDPKLLADARFAGDPEFVALWAGTDTGEFVVLSHGEARVAVRRDLFAVD